MNSEETCTIRLDGREIEVTRGASLLAAALEAGVYIPHLCFHRDLPPASSTLPVEAIYRAGERIENDGGDEPAEGCGLCVVQVEGADAPQPACELQASPGLTVTSVSPELQAIRQEKLAGILAHHPHACVTCAQKEGCSREPCSTNVDEEERCCPKLGRCELEKVAGYIGVPADTPRYLPRGLPVEEEGVFVFNTELCVSCLRCVRACRDLKGADVLGFVRHEGEVVVGRQLEDGIEAFCRFCGACIEVCPTGALTDRVNISGDRAERLVPCRASCPAAMDVPRFLREVARSRLDRAARVALDRLPLPNVLGRVCFHTCENDCRRTDLGGALSVCRIRRVVFDNVDAGLLPWPKPPTTGKRVAVIGSGPAGLAAAHFLGRMGREVTIFEAAAEPGGMLRFGIPDYRLPQEVLERDLRLIRGQGVEIKTGMALGREITPDSLRAEGFHALLVAAGAGTARPLPIEGADLDGVFTGVQFLHDVAVGSFPTKEIEEQNVIVVGGGDVAVDAARTAMRLGASSVNLLCLESPEEMPAHASEVDAARKEGVGVVNTWGPDEILGSSGVVRALRIVRCTSVLDAAGRFAPTYDRSALRAIKADRVIAAIGQQAEPGLAEMAEQEGVFTAGDLAMGPSSVVRSVAGGREAAEAIDRYLGGSGEIPSILDAEEPSQWIGREEGFAARARAVPGELYPTERIKGFVEIEATLACEEAQDEAARCLQCDLRLLISPPVFPPLPWLEFNVEALAAVPDSEGVYQLLGEDRVALKIAGTPNLRPALEEELQGESSARYFLYEEDPMYTQRESELLQQFLAQHGRMPQGDDDLDDLF